MDISVLVISVGRLITIVKSKEEMDRDLSCENSFSESHTKTGEN